MFTNMNTQNEHYRNDKLRERFRQCYRHMTFDPKGHILKSLFGSGVITNDEKRSIQEKRERDDRAEDLMYILFNGSHPRSFIELRESLNEEYSHLVKMVDNHNCFTISCSMNITTDGIELDFIDTSEKHPDEIMSIKWNAKDGVRAEFAKLLTQYLNQCLPWEELKNQMHLNKDHIEKIESHLLKARCAGHFLDALSKCQKELKDNFEKEINLCLRDCGLGKRIIDGYRSLIQNLVGYALDLTNEKENEENYECRPAENSNYQKFRAIGDLKNATRQLRTAQDSLSKLHESIESHSAAERIEKELALLKTSVKCYEKAIEELETTTTTECTTVEKEIRLIESAIKTSARAVRTVELDLVPRSINYELQKFKLATENLVDTINGIKASIPLKLADGLQAMKSVTQKVEYSIEGIVNSSDSITVTQKLMDTLELQMKEQSHFYHFTLVSSEEMMQQYNTAINHMSSTYINLQEAIRSFEQKKEKNKVLSLFDYIDETYLKTPEIAKKKKMTLQFDSNSIINVLYGEYLEQSSISFSEATAALYVNNSPICRICFIKNTKCNILNIS